MKSKIYESIYIVLVKTSKKEKYLERKLYLRGNKRDIDV